MQAGEVVVMDVGAEYEGYAADITRTIPVSGRFSKEQGEVYAVVLRAQQEVFKIIKSGLKWADLDRKAKEVIGGAGFGKFFTHSVSHHLGLDAHDAGTLDTLRTGMVITVEPGIYIPEVDTTVRVPYRGFGIRIEDDVLVGENGCTVLSKNIPREPAEIERLVGR